MISRNGADAKRQALADEQRKTVREEDRQNEDCWRSPSRSST
jgi:hypothetical protein